MYLYSKDYPRNIPTFMSSNLAREEPNCMQSRVMPQDKRVQGLAPSMEIKNCHRGSREMPHGKLAPNREVPQRKEVWGFAPCRV